MNRRKKDKRNIAIIGICLLLGTLYSCLEPRNACLDILATNFDASADEACGDCCNFPALTIDIEHNMGDDQLALRTNYTPDNSQYFTLLDMRYFLSDIQVSGPDVQLRFLDSFNVSVQENGMSIDTRVVNNLQVIQRTVTNTVYGRFKEYGMLDSLSFSIGVPALLNTAAPDDYPSAFPLNTEAETMYWNPDSGYIFNVLSFTRDTTSVTDTLNLNIGLDARRVDIALPFVDTLARATDLTITLEVDYLEWFQGINFVIDSEEEMLAKIVENMPKAFKVKK